MEVQVGTVGYIKWSYVRLGARETPALHIPKQKKKELSKFWHDGFMHNNQCTHCIAWSCVFSKYL